MKTKKDAKGLRVLIVDDNFSNRFLAKTIVESLLENIYLREVEDGDEAVAMYKEKAFDFILMDVQMPKMNGYEASKLIRALEAETEHRSYIIAVTAGILAGEEVKCLASGMDIYMPKPIRINELGTILENYLNQKHAGSQNQGNQRDEHSQLKRFDRKSLLENMGGNESALNQMVAMVKNGIFNEYLNDIERAIQTNDMFLFKKAAHSLKGNALTMYMNLLSEKAKELEQTEDLDVAKANNQLNSIKAEIDEIMKML